jgi:hypothetical protein
VQTAFSFICPVHIYNRGYAIVCNSIHNGIVFLQLQHLCGRRAKRQHQDMQLIEVNGDAIMPNPNEWLTKQMTQEQETKTHSHRKNDGPTTQQRRKHQITYLAFQV